MEQMIVTYHNTKVVYAYKGLFNRNIDYDWSGGILLDLIRLWTSIQEIMVFMQPAPAVPAIFDITFDKSAPYCYYDGHCDTLWGSQTSPTECRWHGCHLPSSISGSQYSVQMTMAIFVR